MTETIVISGREVPMRATAAIPRMYRIRFGRDIMEDMRKIDKAVKKSQEDGETIPPEMLTVFENVAYLMAKHANPELPEKSPDEWLEGFEMFSIYEVFPAIQRLWNLNSLSTSHPAKK